MKKCFIAVLVILSSCQREAVINLPPLDIKGKIIFTTDDPHPFNAYVINTDGTSQLPVNIQLPICRPDFIISNDGKKIVYDGGDSINNYLIISDIDGQNKVILYKGKQICYVPAISPDDSRICFVKFDPDVNTNPYYTYDIYSIKADGSDETRLTFQNNNYSPQYLPDNSGIIYSYSDGSSSSCSSVSGIYKMNIDGSNKHLLTPPGRCFRFPKISPDGKMIAMNSADFNGSQIFTMTLNGSNLKQITFTVDKKYYDTGFPRDGNDNPVWSPNSNKLAYISHEDGNPDIFIINPDGSGNKRLTNNTLFDEDPCWATDGNYIIFASGRNKIVGGQNRSVEDIYIMRSDGQLQTPVTNNLFNSYYPVLIDK